MYLTELYLFDSCGLALLLTDHNTRRIDKVTAAYCVSSVDMNVTFRTLVVGFKIKWTSVEFSSHDDRSNNGCQFKVITAWSVQQLIYSLTPRSCQQPTR